MERIFEPGEWEVDERGRHFRRFGHSVEFAPTISTPYGEFEMGSAPRPSKFIEPPRPKTWGQCPFRNSCSETCARYTESGCGIVTGAPPAIGKRCPFGDARNLLACTEKCALWALCNRKENH